MNVHEYQAKGLLRGFGVSVPRGTMVTSASDARKAAEELGTPIVVVKSQIHAGGRGAGAGGRRARDPRGAGRGARAVSARRGTGRVTLVGAGPGAPDLITLRGAAALARRMPWSTTRSRRPRSSPTRDPRPGS